MITKDEIQALLHSTETYRVERTTSTGDMDKFQEAICAFAKDLPNSRKKGYLISGGYDNVGKDVGKDVGGNVAVKMAVIMSSALSPASSPVVTSWKDKVAILKRKSPRSKGVARVKHRSSLYP